VTKLKYYIAAVTAHREGSRLNILKRKFLRKIFGFKREEVRGISKIAQ
jgi:hypothetical protein